MTQYTTVTKIARARVSMTPNALLEGNVRRVTPKAVQFACLQLPTKYGMDTPSWFPRSALVDGANVTEASTQITVQGWFMEKNAK